LGSGREDVKCWRMGSAAEAESMALKSEVHCRVLVLSN
jgi:hypothetical protein